MNILTVIPARGGSKRIPRKNLALCGGKPLIQWTIEAAKEAGLDPVVDTDSMEIGTISTVMGCNWWIHRPGSLATDSALGIDVILHAAEIGKKHGYTHLVYLQPTSPLRNADDIRRGVSLMEHHDPVIGVTKYSYVDLVDPYGWKSGYRICGAFWGAAIERLLRQKMLYGTLEECQATVEIPPERALDIDTPFDLHVADLLLSARKS